MKLKNIEINHSTNQIKIVRSIKVSPQSESSKTLYDFPENISNGGGISIQDPLAHGSSIVYPFVPNFPKDLIRFEGKRFKFITKSKTQIVGIFVYYKAIDDDQYGIVVEVEAFFSELSDRTLPKGPYLVSSLDVLEYFPLEEPDELCRKPKVRIDSTETPREIIVSYSIPFEAYSMCGRFVHGIKGIKSSSLYSWDEQLASDFEITVTTTYYWSPIWTIEDADVTLVIIKDDFVYVVNNVSAAEYTISPLVLSSYKTTGSRAMLLQPGQPLEMSIYFKSLSNMSNDLVYFEDDYHCALNTNLDQIFNINNDDLSNVNDASKFYRYTHQMLNPTKINSFAVIKLNFKNNDNQIYINFSYKPSLSSNQRSIVFPKLKISKECTHIAAQYSESMVYSFHNCSNSGFSVLVYKDLGMGYNKLKSMLCSDLLKLDDSLYMFESKESSIFEFQIKVLSSKTFYLNYSLPTQIINFLNQKDLKVDPSPNVFQNVSLEKFGIEFHKGLGSLLKNEDFDDKQISKPIAQDSPLNENLPSLESLLNNIFM